MGNDPVPYRELDDRELDPELPLGRLGERLLYLAGGWPLRRRGARRCGLPLPVALLV